MKFANRLNPWYRKGNNVEFNGDYYEIVHVEPGWIEADILVLANVANLAPGASVPAIAAGATAGELIPALQSKYQDGFIHVIPAVPGVAVVEQVPVDGSGAPAGPVDRVREISPRFTYFNAEAQPRWYDPDFSGLSFIDNRISPTDDPNELFSFFLLNNDEPAFRATNPHANFTFTTAIIEFNFFLYEIEQLASKPRIFSPIPYDRTTLARFEERLKKHRYG
jgi:hypothetical protein